MRIRPALLVCVLATVALVACSNSSPTPVPVPSLAPLPESGTAPPAVTVEAPPTFTPGPATVSKNRLLYVRNGRFMTANADGSDKRPLFGDNTVNGYAPPRDPGRAWVSPSGKQIAFLGDPGGALWIADVNGSNLHKVSESLLPGEGLGTDQDRENAVRRMAIQEITWTPDESRLALIGAPKATIDLFIVDLKTGQVIQVTDDAFREDRFSWSPDGAWLVYTSFDEKFANERVYVVGADGSQPLEIPTDPIVTASGLNAGTLLAGALEPTWLDATHLFFYPVVAKGSLGIWSYDLISRSVKPITQVAVATPDWSPVTHRWVFAKQRELGPLFTLGLEGGEPQQVVAENGFAPIWSPDGNQIVYSAGAEASADEWEIHIIGADGSNDRSLAKGFKLIGFDPPEPSPNGKRFWSGDKRSLLFTTVGTSYGNPGPQGEAGPDLENWWMVSVDGGEPQKLTDLERVFYLQGLEPSPDGQSYAFVGFYYLDRALHLWTFSRDGGHVAPIDGGVRWFLWLR
jgi:Tol biopolymer transport system component